MRIKITLSRVLLVLLVLSLAAEFIVWLCYPDDEKGTIDGTGVYYPAFHPYVAFFMNFMLILIGTGFFCLIMLLVSLWRSVKDLSWSFWLINIILCVVGCYLTVSLYIDDISGGPW